MNDISKWLKRLSFLVFVATVLAAGTQDVAAQWCMYVTGYSSPGRLEGYNCGLHSSDPCQDGSIESYCSSGCFEFFNTFDYTVESCSSYEQPGEEEGPHWILLNGACSCNF